MMERILGIYLTAVWILVPSFFWVRGFWRNDWKDRLAAVVLNGVLILAVGVAGDLCAGINASGFWLFVIGLGTLALGAFRKVMPTAKLIQMCLLMVTGGMLMMMVL